MSVAREREQGTFDQLLVTPFRPAEIMAGKALPSLLVGMVQATTILLVAQLWFRIPFAGSFVTLYAGLSLFLLAAVGIGLGSSIGGGDHAAGDAVLVHADDAVHALVGTGHADQQHAEVLQYLTLVNPLRYAIDIVHRVYLEERGWPAAARPVAAGGHRCCHAVGGLLDVPPPAHVNGRNDIKRISHAKHALSKIEGTPTNEQFYRIAPAWAEHPNTIGVPGLGFARLKLV